MEPREGAQGTDTTDLMAEFHRALAAVIESKGLFSEQKWGSGTSPTLRDQLAMVAPVDEVCMLVSAETYGTDIREIVLARYKWADAMLEARGYK